MAIGPGNQCRRSRAKAPRVKTLDRHRDALE